MLIKIKFKNLILLHSECPKLNRVLAALSAIGLINVFAKWFYIFVSHFQDQGNKRQSIHMSETPRGSWASSIFDLKQSQADAQLPDLFDRISQEDIDKKNEIQRQQHRQDTMFALYPTQDEVSVTSLLEIIPVFVSL